MALRLSGRLLIATAIFTPLLVQSAQATSVVRMSPKEMAAASPSIVHGTVVSTHTRWNQNHSLIITDVRIRVLATFKGEEVAELVVTQPGGVVGKLKVEVPGAAWYRSGDEVVLFLAPDGRGKFHVNGLSQGRFDVVKDTRTGGEMVRGFSFDANTAAPGLVPLRQFLENLGDLIREVDGKERK